MNMDEYIAQEVQKTIATLQSLNDLKIRSTIIAIANACITALNNGKKILFAGNGGSAADSQHLAAELISKLCYNRPGLAAIALTTDTSALTAIGNDYNFEQIFARQIESIANPGDVLIAISTSGKSANIIAALKTAKNTGLFTVGFTGQTGGLMPEYCDLILNAPSQETPKIQECHIIVGHIVCAMIEESIFGKQFNPKYSVATI